MTVKERLDAMVDMADMEQKMKETQVYNTATDGVYPIMTGGVWTPGRMILGVQIFPPDIHAVAKEVGAEVLETKTESYFVYKNIAFSSTKAAFQMRYTANDCVGCPDGCRCCGRDRDYTVVECDKCREQLDLANENVFCYEGKDYCKDCFREILIEEINQNDDISIYELATLAGVEYDEEDYDE